jgi:glycosyltransferase involved in cell wall biosynthesis
MLSFLRRILNRSQYFQPDNQTLELWDALRDLNNRIVAEPSASILSLARSTHNHLHISGKVEKNFIKSISPLLCKHGEFSNLLAWTDVVFLKNLNKTRNAWELTIAISYLTEIGKVEQATDLMVELREKLNVGWLNTECIHYTIKKVQHYESSRILSAVTAERFRISFIQLLDAFKGEWASRLHDVELIKAMVSLLANHDCYTPQHFKIIADGALRHYGLCPVFWQIWSETRPSIDLKSKENLAQLNESEKHWQTIHATLQGESENLATYWFKLHPALEWFYEQKNPEVLTMMTDIAAKLSTSQSTTDRELAEEIIIRIGEMDPGEMKRWETKTSIWPTFEAPKEGLNNNQLELLTPTEKSHDLLQQTILVASVVRNEMILLPHFLTHYRKLGVNTFIFIDNASDDGTTQFLLEQPDVVIYLAKTEYKKSIYGVVWQQAILGNHGLGKWVLLADADEFLTYPNWQKVSLAQFIDQADAQGSDAILTFMIDMYPDGPLEEADFTRAKPFEAAPLHDANPLIEWRLGSGQYSNSNNYLSALRHRLINNTPPNAFSSQKVALTRYQPWIRYSAGLHNAANVEIAKYSAIFAHFKYHSGFLKKVEEEVLRGQHFNGAEEYRYYYNFLKIFNRKEIR